MTVRRISPAADGHPGARASTEYLGVCPEPDAICTKFVRWKRNDPSGSAHVSQKVLSPRSDWGEAPPTWSISRCALIPVSSYALAREFPQSMHVCGGRQRGLVSLYKQRTFDMCTRRIPALRPTRLVLMVLLRRQTSTCA